MKGARTGVGLVFGAGFGLVLGLILFDNWWLGLIIGAAAGLIIGAVADLPATGGESGDSADDEAP